MTHEYGDPIHSEAMENAVALVLESQRRSPGVALDIHVAEAVRRSFCACVTDIEDAIEGGLSGVHAAIVDEVTRQARRQGAICTETADPVDEASRQSFPASDAPAWIWRRRTDD